MQVQEKDWHFEIDAIESNNTKKKEIKNVGPFFKDIDLRKRPKGQEHTWYNVINIEGDMSSIWIIYNKLILILLNFKIVAKA